jgi:tRNA splicing ligase
MSDQATESTASEVVSELYEISNSIDRKKSKTVRHKEFVLPLSGVRLTSWTMLESEYKKDPCPFPVMARGLFTRKLDDTSYEVAVRGYDKFFNLGETKFTQVLAGPSD